MTILFKGRVARIYANEAGCGVRLDTLDQATAARSGPPNAYFHLAHDHPNYNALYSLALAAAANRWELYVRTKTDVVPTTDASVQYFVVDWVPGQDGD